MHHASWTDPLFLAEYRGAPSGFCRSCHAPAADASREPDAVAAAEGVGCASCHGSARSPTEHPPPSTVASRTSRACAGCHEFDFPSETQVARIEWVPGDRLQRTFTEWRSSEPARAGASCQSCHMPWRRDPDGGRHRDHRILGTRDGAFLASAVRPSFRARRVAGGVELVATLSPGTAGHAFPTGDLYRRLELTVSDGDGARTSIFARRFLRVLDEVRRRFLLREAFDDRVPPPGAGRAPVVRMRFAQPPAGALRVALDYLRMPRDAAARKGHSDAENRVRLVETDVASPR